MLQISQGPNIYHLFTPSPSFPFHLSPWLTVHAQVGGHVLGSPAPPVPSFPLPCLALILTASRQTRRILHSLVAGTVLDATVPEYLFHLTA